MKIDKPAKLQTAIRAGMIISCVGIIVFFGMESRMDFGSQAGIQTVIAATSYGIMGRQAPELNLNTWIDGNGKPMDSIKLEACRGKVIYLYFFQSW